MKENKDIERLFREKLGNFEASPPPQVWQKIDAKLSERKAARKTIPFWLKNAGIAALLVIGFGLWYENTPQAKIQIQEENHTTEEEQKYSTVDKKENDFKKTEREVTAKETWTGQSSSVAQSGQKALQQRNTTAKTEYLLPQGEISENVFSEAVATSEIVEKERFVTKQETGIATQPEQNVLEELLRKKEEEGTNADEKEKVKRGKWAVSTAVSPVYFNSRGQGSPIGNEFAQNAKSYETTMSYGAGVAYGISRKFTVRAGANSVALRYNTHGVRYNAVLASARQMQNGNKELNIAYNKRSRNLALYSAKASAKLYDDVENYSPKNNLGTLRQELSYVEIPLELSYKVLDKRFGISVSSGVSTLLLNGNTMSLRTADGMETEIGKANNLRNVHFSTNVGLGLDYAVMKSVNVFVQPTLRYQHKTFNDTSAAGFKPYYAGINSGISYSF